MEGDVKIQHGKDQAAFAFGVFFYDLAIAYAVYDVIDGNSVFESLSKGMIDNIELAGFNLLANHRNVHTENLIDYGR